MKSLKRTYSDILFYTIIMVLLAGCAGNQKEDKSMDQEKEFDKGTFGYDVNFLKKYYEDLILLESKEGEALALVSTQLQGRIMTTSAEGMSGKSFGWLNYDLIKSQEKQPHFNPVGGEERFWLGPEGGQFSTYFKENSEFSFDNWYVPKEIDTEPFELLSKDKQTAKFTRTMNLVNYSGNKLDIKVNRDIRLIDGNSISKLLGTVIDDKVSFVGVESENTLINVGKNEWNRSYGMPSVWILSMLNPSEETVIFLPFNPGPEEDLGVIFNDNYFGKISSDRIRVKDSTVFFKADGKSRGKVGLSPQRAKSIAGSYDAKNKVLTIAQFSLPEGAEEYVNSAWEIQDNPFKGDAVNAYNDGPLEDGSIMGPFYEIESSSPAANLSPGESLTHVHRTFHFTGTFEDLNAISKKILGVDLATTSTVFD